MQRGRTDRLGVFGLDPGWAAGRLAAIFSGRRNHRRLVWSKRILCASVQEIAEKELWVVWQPAAVFSVEMREKFRVVQGSSNVLSEAFDHAYHSWQWRLLCARGPAIPLCERELRLLEDAFRAVQGRNSAQGENCWVRGKCHNCQEEGLWVNSVIERLPVCAKCFAQLLLPAPECPWHEAPARFMLRWRGNSLRAIYVTPCCGKQVLQQATTVPVPQEWLSV